MENNDLQSAMLAAIKELRNDPDRYQELRRKVSACQSDEERASILVEFAVNDDQLARAVPGIGAASDSAEAINPTITVTIIIVSPTIY